METTKGGHKVALLLGFALTVLLSTLAWISREDILFFREFERLGTNGQGYPEYRHRQTGIVFVRVPGGTFLMGSPDGEEGREEYEGPVHEVTLSPFLIAKYEVSQDQWNRVLDVNPSQFRGDGLPVDGVTRELGERFCSSTGLSLPTEAQWEYACRAETDTPFSWGRTITVANANYNGSRYGGGPQGEFRDSTVKVDSFEPNAFGIFQMHGNVAEWCADTFDPGFYVKPEATRPDPVCSLGRRYVMRGGCWGVPASECRSAARDRFAPVMRQYVPGIRPAASAPP